ncbi:MAG: hypothetical protein ABI876_07820 [Bacteroidota bacterium]
MLESFDDQSLQFNVLAATLRMEGGESSDMLELLAEKLESAIPSHTGVKRSGGLFSRKQTVQEIAVDFDEQTYRIVRGKHGTPSATIARKVRGIVLKTTETPLATWTDELAGELFRMAEKSIETKEALQKLILG